MIARLDQPEGGKRPMTLRQSTSRFVRKPSALWVAACTALALTGGALAQDVASSGGADYQALFDAIEPLTNDQITENSTVYTQVEQPLFLRPGDDSELQQAGLILSATALEIMEQTDSGLRVILRGWTEEGAERAVHEMMGQRIMSATLTPAAVAEARFGTPVVDPNTDILWSPVTIEVWIDPGNLVSERKPLWDYGAAMFTAACVNCHSTMTPHDYLANQWIGTLKSMERYLTLNKQEYRALQKYVQLHAQDTIVHGSGG